MDNTIIEALSVSGPLSLVLGLAVKTLWSKLGALEAKVDQERANYDSRIDNLHDEQKQLLLDLNTTLRGLLTPPGDQSQES